MTDSNRDQRLSRMIDQVVSRRLETRVENLSFLLLVLLVDGFLVLVSQGYLADHAGKWMFAMFFVAVNTILFLVAYSIRRRRKAALLNFVMPRDQSGGRRVDQEAYIMLASEHRVIEEADFRRKLAKAIKKTR